MSGIIDTVGSKSGIVGSDVYPAGHMIQCRVYHSDITQVNVTSTSFNTADVICTNTFTPLRASSNILLFAHIHTHVDDDAVYLYLDFYKNASDVTETANLSGNSAGLMFTRKESSWHGTTYSHLDTCSENSLSEKTYKMSARINATGSGWLGWGSSIPTYMMIQEITA